MTDDVKLKPCPFCGGKARIDGDFEHGYLVLHSCADGSMSFRAAGNTERQAIARWNRRAAILAMDRRASPPAEPDDKWMRACAAQSRKLQYVLCIPGVKEALAELNWETWEPTPAPAVAVPEGATSLGWVDHLETHLDEDGQASPSNVRDLIRICRTVAADRDAWKNDALSMQRLLGRARKLTKQTFPGGGTITAEIDAVLTGKPPATTKAFGWARGVHQPSTPNGPAEYDVDFVYGDDEPAGDGWFPVYREPAPAVADDPANDAAFRVLRDAGDKLSLAAQTTGGTAGRDDGLVAAVDGWTAARNKALQLRRIARYEPAPAVAVPEGWRELRDNLDRVTDHLSTWAADHADDATTETHAALYCARDILARTAAAPEPPATRSYEEGIEAAAWVAEGAIDTVAHDDRLETADLVAIRERDQKIATAIRSLADEPRHGE